MKKFLSDYWLVIVYVIGIALIIGFSVSNNNNKSDYGSSSKSGIYYSETCPITTCNDGACSTSTGRGTCSHHGGIRH